MHFKIEFDAEDYLFSLGLVKKKEWLWIKNELTYGDESGSKNMA